MRSINEPYFTLSQLLYFMRCCSKRLADFTPHVPSVN